MRKLCANKKAVSPVVATVLMILVVMAGMTILFAFIGSYAKSFQIGSGSSVLESMTVEDVWFNPAPTDKNLYMWVYNIGGTSFTINSVYLNSVLVWDLRGPGVDGANVYNSNGAVIDSNTQINVGEHVRLLVAPWEASGEEFTVKIVTGRGTSLQQTFTSGV